MTQHAATPLPLTRFVGRQRELQEVRALLDSCRLVTITGTGGAGKTRLAREVAARFESTAPGRTRWIDLSPLSDPALVEEHVAGVLGSPERLDGDLRAALAASLGGEPRLLVLDNCEHLVAECAQLAAHLLKACPALKILATSREALGIDGERAWLLRGLALDAPPSASGDSLNEAAEFFADRASAVNPRFRIAPNLDAINRICRRLDGIPLAIELAAARLGVLTTEEIASRLDDLFRLLPSGKRFAPVQQRTLRATVEWSYGLIGDEERELLRRISVFAGAFSLEAAEIVCADDALSEDRVLDVLSGLVNRSLVSMHESRDTARYSTPEFIRQYALELLEAQPGRAAVFRRAHAVYHAGLAEAAFAQLERTHSPAWTARLVEDYDNLRAALGWSFETGALEIAHRLVGALGWHWSQTWQLSEWQQWLELALRSEPAAPSRAFGLVLNSAGSVRYMKGEREQARQLLSRAVEVFHACDDPLHEALARTTLANVLCSQGDLESALEHAERAANLARPTHEPWALCHVMSNGLAFVHLRLGNHEVAERCLVEAQESMSLSDPHHWGLLEVARARAVLALDSRRVDAAIRHALVALRSSQSTLRPHSMYRVLVVAERLLCETRNFTVAASVGAALAAARDVGLRPFPDDARLRTESAALLARSAESGAPSGLSRAGRAIPLAEALEVALGSFEAMVPDLSTPPGPPAHRADFRELRVDLLGPVRVTIDGTAVPGHTLRQVKLLELLAYLLLHPAGGSRDQIGAALWPEMSAGQVKNNFHVLLHKLRRLLGGPDAVTVSVERYRLDPSLRVHLDATVLRSVADAARAAPRSVSRENLVEAIRLFRGELLEGLEVGEWCAEFQFEARRAYLDSLAALARMDTEAGDAESAAAHLLELVRQDPAREDASRRLMKHYAAMGKIDEAAAHFRWLTARLQEEFGVAPAADTVALARTLTAKISP